MTAPTPWKIAYSSTGSGAVIGITDANGRDIRACAIGSTTAAEGGLNSEVIVRAVNAHDALVEALMQCRSELASLHHGDCDMEHAEKHSAGLRMANAALAQADAPSP